MNNFKKNYVYQVVYQLFSFLTTIILTPYLSRVLGADGVGINSYVTANVTYFTLVGNMGLFGYGQREVALYRDDKEKVSKLFWELEALHLICFLIVSAGYAVVILLAGKNKLFYLINYLTILASLVEINWFFQAYERFDLICKRNIAIKCVTVLCVFMFVKSRNDLALYMFLIAFGLFGGNIILWLSLKKYLVPVNRSKLCIKQHIKDTLIFFLPTIAGSVYSLLDKSVINWITHSDNENGYYEQAHKVLLIINVVVQSFATVMAPAMTHLYSLKKHEEIKQKLDRALQFMLAVSVACAFGLLSIVDRFVPVFFGDGYEPVISILYLFMPLVIVLGYSVYIDGLYLVPVGLRKKSAMAVCVGALSNLVLNTVLVYYMKSFGAALATLLTELIVFSIMAYLARNALIWKNQARYLLKYLICGGVMFFAVRALDWFFSLKSETVFMIIQIAVGAAVYFLMLALMRDSLLFVAIGILSSKAKELRRRK